MFASIVTSSEFRGHRLRCRVDMDRVQVGFHAMGPNSGSLGASSIPEDYRLRVFGTSGIRDRPYDRLYVQTIPLTGCMDRRCR